MIEFFIQLVNMSIIASWLILAILLFKIILNKVPKSLIIFLWFLLLIRCIFPNTFESSFCIIPSTQTIPKDIISNLIPHIQSNISFIDSTINAILYESAIYHNSVFSFIEISAYFLTFIWILGFIIIGVYFLYTFCDLKEKIKISIYYEDNIYYCEDIESPFIFGFNNPKIYLPMEIEEEHIKYVLLHEQLHIKRKDYIWKWIGTLLLIIYWFNPFMWIAYSMFNKDIEMSIDELVVKDMNAQEKIAYCEALIALSNKENHRLFHTLAFGEINIKQRIKNVLHYKKPSVIKYCILIVSYIVLIFTCLSQPIQSNVSSQGIAIEELSDWDYYSNVFDNIERVEIGNEESSYTTILSKDVNNILKNLSEIRVIDMPISHNRSLERDKSYYLILQSDTKTNLYFNHDFTELWINRNDKSSLSYRILNYEKIYTMFSSFEIAEKDVAFIDARIVETAEEKWIVKSTLDNITIYEIDKSKDYSDLEIGDHIRILYCKKDNDSIIKRDEIKTIFFINDVEIVKFYNESQLHTLDEIEEAINKIVLNTPQLTEYSYVELYYDENEAQLFMKEHSIENDNTIVVFANLKASKSIQDNKSKVDATASFVIGPNTYMSVFKTK